MTFVSAEDKTAAVTRLTKVGVDTSTFDNSPRIQVEHARAVSVRPPPPPPPPPSCAKISGPPPLAAPAPATTVAAAKVAPQALAPGVEPPRKTTAASTRVMLAREKALKALEVERLIAAESAKARTAGAAALGRSPSATEVRGQGTARVKGRCVARKESVPSGGKAATGGGKKGSKRMRTGEVQVAAGGTGRAAAADATCVAKKAKVVPDTASAAAAGAVAALSTPLRVPAQLPAAAAPANKISAAGKSSVGRANAGSNVATVGDGPDVRRSPSPVPPAVRKPPPASSTSTSLPKSAASSSPP
ncbi:unnamed protein product, partial [Hapterophycus canaliculatus]